MIPFEAALALDSEEAGVEACIRPSKACLGAGVAMEVMIPRHRQDHDTIPWDLAGLRLAVAEDRLDADPAGLEGLGEI